MSQAQIERIELDQLTCWRVRLGGAELLVAQQGAQVLSFQQDDQPPLIWLSERAAYMRGQPVRGGVPICWPWFGDLGRNPQAVQAQHASPGNAPFHGDVRSRDWQLQGIDSEGESVHLRFAFDTRLQPLPDWPHAASVQLDIRLGEGLHLELASHNLGETPLTISQALHSYFAVGDIHQASVEGLHGCRYIDTLENWQECQQDGPLRFAGETDRLYLDTPAQLSILDPAWHRRILLACHGSRSAVLWNPWIDKAQRLSQFANGAWRDMLCIEHANVLDDIRMLAAGECHRLAVHIDSQAL